jgi:hypothetical protein
MKNQFGCASRPVKRKLVKAWGQALGQRLKKSGRRAEMMGDRAKSKHSTSTNSYAIDDLSLDVWAGSGRCLARECASRQC